MYSLFPHIVKPLTWCWVVLHLANLDIEGVGQGLGNGPARCALVWDGVQRERACEGVSTFTLTVERLGLCRA